MLSSFELLELFKAVHLVVLQERLVPLAYERTSKCAHTVKAYSSHVELAHIDICDVAAILIE